jgi:hypothetical protein
MSFRNARRGTRRETGLPGFIGAGDPAGMIVLDGFSDAYRQGERSFLLGSRAASRGTSGHQPGRNCRDRRTNDPFLSAEEPALSGVEWALRAAKRSRQEKAALFCRFAALRSGRRQQGRENEASDSARLREWQPPFRGYHSLKSCAFTRWYAQDFL